MRGLPKGSGNGHYLINRSGTMAVHLEVGARSPADVTICSDVDMMSANADGRFVRKDGTPYREPETSRDKLRAGAFHHYVARGRDPHRSS